MQGLLAGKELDRFLQALRYAADMHTGQFKKGCSALPYINHPIKVAALLASGAAGPDMTLLIAAVLHDVLEKTAADPGYIRKEFGRAVLDIVREVTDDKGLPEPQRKQKQVEIARSLSPAAKKIRLADKICNMLDIMTYPLRWSKKRKLAYFEHAAALAAELRGTDGRLDRLFRKEHAAGMRELEGD